MLSFCESQHQIIRWKKNMITMRIVNTDPIPRNIQVGSSTCSHFISGLKLSYFKEKNISWSDSSILNIQPVYWKFWLVVYKCIYICCAKKGCKILGSWKKNAHVTYIHICLRTPMRASGTRISSWIRNASRSIKCSRYWQIEPL